MAQLAFSLLASFLSFSSAVGLVGLGFVQLYTPEGTRQQTLVVFIAAASGLLTAVLLLPSAWFALLRLIGRPVVSPAWMRWLSERPILPVLAIILLAPVFFLGGLVSKNPQAAWLLLPPIQLLAVGLPVYIFSTIGRWKLTAGSPQLNWGIFSAGLVLGPLIILSLEVLALVGLGLLAIVYVSLRPDLQSELTLLGRQINAAGDSPEAIFNLLKPYLLNPLAILALFTFVSGIVPLIEEIFKPIGAWLAAGSRLTAAQGFAAGLLSGTGYALFENLALSNAGSDWTIILAGRIGTAVLHITTAGLTGWALITAVNERRYLRLGVVFLLSVFIHGLWNALALLSAVSQLEITGAGSTFSDFAQISRWAYVGLGIMVVLIILILLTMNRLLQRKTAPAA